MYGNFTNTFSTLINDKNHHKGNKPKIVDFDVFSLLEFRKRKSRFHGLRQKGNNKRKMRAVIGIETSLKDLLQEVKGNGRHSLLFISLHISV